MVVEAIELVGGLGGGGGDGWDGGEEISCGDTEEAEGEEGFHGGDILNGNLQSYDCSYAAGR